MNDKNLNLIFFVDANKTRRFQLSIKQVVAISVLTGIMLIWAVTSIAMVVNLSNKDNEQFARIRELQNAIFSYQTRYENIYEKAYSIDQSYEPEIAEEIITTPAQKSPLTIAEKDLKNKPKVKQTKKQDPTALNNKEDSDTLKDIVVTSIKVVNLEKQNQLTVWYSIKNNNSRKRAIGFVVGNAYFVGADGKETVIESPENWINTKEYDSFSKKHKYKIKRFKRTNMTFTLPKNVKGSVKRIELIIISKNNDRKVITHKIGEKKSNQ